MNSYPEPPPQPGSKPEPTVSHPKPGAVLALCAIIACVVFVVRMQSAHRAGGGEEVRPNRVLELMARYAVGVKELLQLSGNGGRSAGAGASAGASQAMLVEVKKLCRSSEDELRRVILEGWLGDAWPDEAALDALAARNEGLREDVRTLRQLRALRGKVADEAWEKLHGRHGWLADLARAQAAGDGVAMKNVAQAGLKTAVFLMCASFVGLVAVVGGMGVLLLAFVRWRDGKLSVTLAMRSQAEGGVLLEGFAIFLALFLFPAWLLRRFSMPLPGWAAYGPAVVALAVGMMWPLWRGMQRSQWREALGLHRGHGLWREMGAGVLGWLASLPMLVLGMVAASWIMKLTGEFPTHPIVDAFAGSGWMRLGAILLAVVWAPVSEEIMFRGLLFPALSAWLRWLMGVVLSAFVFAVIHPQGWAGVPAIMMLAGSFSLLRLWRRSLIAPMTAHALNNGVMCVAMLLLW
ncbi:CPBP family intramembrane glutamic endopeptidase [Prosthecobacter fluviatilis]|uniref:CPBP family intramembrane glutamic endopeptidase n=1 Tax=Prosthecobacter fluviatilis TaxID=445931 RepID=A0ABW0KJX1_9BACT